MKRSLVSVAAAPMVNCSGVIAFPGVSPAPKPAGIPPKPSTETTIVSSTGAGADKFIFNANDGVDTITDFSPVDDTIVVSADGFGSVPAGFGAGLTPGQAITASQFTIGAAATDTSDRFIYNRSTGALFFDADGIGSTDQVQIASLSTGLAMNNTDIFVIA